MNEMADFVVVGAGVYGAGVALHLAEAGADVVVLDSREVATQASGGPGRRGVRANGRDVRELPLMQRAYDTWPDLHERLGADPFYERVGQLLVFESEKDADVARAQAWVQHQHKIPTDWLTKGPLLEREPELSDAVRGALFCPLDGVARHADVTRAYARAAERAGAKVRTGEPVVELIIEHGRARGVRTADGHVVSARKGVMVLANSSVAQMIAALMSIPVWNECLQVLVSKPLARVPFKHLIGHFSRTISLKTEGVDQVMLSGGWPGQWNDDRHVGETLPQSVAANVAEGVALVPALAGIEVSEADASHLETMAIDRVPIIDRVTGVDGAWFACGWCGHGWAIAPTIVELLAEWATTNQQPELLRPFALSRFN